MGLDRRVSDSSDVSRRMLIAEPLASEHFERPGVEGRLLRLDRASAGGEGSRMLMGVSCHQSTDPSGRHLGPIEAHRQYRIEREGRSNTEFRGRRPGRRPPRHPRDERRRRRDTPGRTLATRKIGGHQGVPRCGGLERPSTSRGRRRHRNRIEVCGYRPCSQPDRRYLRSTTRCGPLPRPSPRLGRATRSREHTPSVPEPDSNLSHEDGIATRPCNSRPKPTVSRCWLVQTVDWVANGPSSSSRTFCTTRIAASAAGAPQ